MSLVLTRPSVVSRKFVPYVDGRILLGRSFKTKHFGDSACHDTYSANLRDGILGAIDDYEGFLQQLDRVWEECARVLVPGGRICCVVGDVCIPRKKNGRHLVVPLHADILVRARKTGLDALTPILWFKIANGSTEVVGNGCGFYGKPYQPGAIVKNDFEYILFLRLKPGSCGWYLAHGTCIWHFG